MCILIRISIDPCIHMKSTYDSHKYTHTHTHTHNYTHTCTYTYKHTHTHTHSNTHTHQHTHFAHLCALFIFRPRKYARAGKF